MSGVLESFRRSRFFQGVKRRGSPTAEWAWFRFRGGLHYARAGHVLRKRTLERYLASTDEPALHIGAGPVSIPGWLNTDYVSGDVFLDLGRPLPFPDGTFKYVFGEHVIEHLPEAVGFALMKEIRRVLRPGGVLRFTTPELPKLIAIYEDRNPVIKRDEYGRWLDQITAKENRTAAQILNNFMREWGHRFIYDEEDLTRKLLDAGFEKVVRCEPGESEHERLRGLERHGPEWENAAEAMCLEATTPA